MMHECRTQHVTEHSVYAEFVSRMAWLIEVDNEYVFDNKVEHNTVHDHWTTSVKGRYGCSLSLQYFFLIIMIDIALIVYDRRTFF